MTTHRTATHRMPRRPDPKPLSDPNRPVERVVMAGLVLGVLAGAGWIGGMIYTVVTWPF
ncbi:morphogenic membrane protein MmpA [Streptomyces sp. NPDC090106]|uniref:morphogenic membrane protein MmpA n=1 Tax=Streptomyces sp. NPDC090106 TaxID=3365946 RepID=UPI00381375A4